MANVSINRVGELIRCVFELLWHKPDGLVARELLAIVPETIKLTSYELALSPSTNMPRYERIIRLATIPLVKVGWLSKNDKGRWFITSDGRQACKTFSNVQELYASALRSSEKESQNAPGLLMTLEIVQEDAWEQIQKFLQERNSAEMRTLVVDLLKAMQYHITWVAPPEKNHGQIDMVANVDPIGARSCRILVQVKHKGQPVTMEGLKSFLSILGPDDYGLLMSTGGFTAEIREEIWTGGFKKINAMDMEKFFDLWIKNFAQLSPEARNRFHLKAVHLLAPLD